MSRTTDIYTDGTFLEREPEWGAEDSPFKARHVAKILSENGLSPTEIVDVGCGSATVISELAGIKSLRDAHFFGFDVSPQAIELAERHGLDNADFLCTDFFDYEPDRSFELLLALDVLEHVPDYLGFLEQCRERAEYKLYHIPLDISVSTVARNRFMRSRDTVGHLHFFGADSALDTVVESGHEIVAYNYTCGGIELFREHPTPKRALANVFRWSTGLVNERLSARWFGGYSLMVLAK